MLTGEKLVAMQRRTIEELGGEIESLKEELEDYRELKQQHFVKQQFGLTESSMWNQPLVLTGVVAFIAGVAMEFYHQLAPGMLGKILTIATMALLTFGIAYAAQRERHKKYKEYIAEYRRLYGSPPRFVADL